MWGGQCSRSVGSRGHHHLSVGVRGLMALVCEVRGQWRLCKGSQNSCVQRSETGRSLSQARGGAREVHISPELQVIQQCEGNPASNIWKSFQTVCEWGGGTEGPPASRLQPPTTRAHSCVKQQQSWSSSVFWVVGQSQGFSFISCEPMGVELLPPTQDVTVIDQSHHTVGVCFHKVSASAGREH